MTRPVQARCKGVLIGAVVGREGEYPHTDHDQCGYIAMLAVAKDHRRRGIGRQLVLKTVEEMKKHCFMIELEAEHVNAGAIRLYESLGFIRTNRMAKYYLHGSDAFRLKLPLRAPRWLGPSTASE
jgi:N-alpha-acetyltransferase 30